MNCPFHDYTVLSKMRKIYLQYEVDSSTLLIFTLILDFSLTKGGPILPSTLLFSQPIIYCTLRLQVSCDLQITVPVFLFGL